MWCYYNVFCNWCYATLVFRLLKVSIIIKKQLSVDIILIYLLNWLINHMFLSYGELIEIYIIKIIKYFSIDYIYQPKWLSKCPFLNYFSVTSQKYPGSCTNLFWRGYVINHSCLRYCVIQFVCLYIWERFIIFYVLLTNQRLKAFVIPKKKHI